MISFNRMVVRNYTPPSCPECATLMTHSNCGLLVEGCFYCPNCYYYTDQSIWDYVYEIRFREMEKISLCTPKAS